MLAGSLDYEETLRRVAWLAVPDAGRLVHGRPAWASAAWSASRWRTPTRRALAEGLQGPRDRPAGRPGPAAVAAHGRSELHPRSTTSCWRGAARPAPSPSCCEIGVRSAASVPMTLRGQRLGVITLSDRRVGPTLGPEQLELAEELGRRAAVAVDNARLYRQRSAIARTLQNSLLPPVLPEIAGVETAAVYRAAGEGIDVGGDFYDLFSVGEDEWIAVIGDVCGKGAEAAAVTALARYTIRTAAVRRRSPAAILRWLNDAMLRQDLEGRFCTIACVHLDTSRADARDGRLRRPSAAAAAARRRDGRGARHGWDAARPGRGPEAAGPRAELHPATRSCSTRTGSRRRGRPTACGGPGPGRGAGRDAAARGAGGRGPRRGEAVLGPATRRRATLSRRRRRAQGCQPRRAGVAVALPRVAGGRLVGLPRDRVASPRRLAALLGVAALANVSTSGLALEVATSSALASARSSARAARPWPRPCAPPCGPCGERGVVGEVAGGLLDAAVILSVIPMPRYPWSGGGPADPAESPAGRRGRSARCARRPCAAARARAGSGARRASGRRRRARRSRPA